MTRLLNPQTTAEEEISDASVEDLAVKRGSVLTGSREGPQRVRMYDLVDGTWTVPMEAGAVHGHYLKKYVSKCSACGFATMKPSFDGVERHIKKVAEDYRLHKGAKVVRQDSEHGVVERCSSCGQRWIVRPGRGQQHIDSAVQAGPLHKDARGMITLRYSLEAPRKPVLPTVHPNGHAGPETGKVDWSLMQRQRGRRRRRSRSKHGNSGS